MPFNINKKLQLLWLYISCDLLCIYNTYFFIDENKILNLLILAVQYSTVSADATWKAIYSLYHRYYDCIYTSGPAAIILGILS